ncbi:MAG: hypothetical protein KAG26_08955, partial [Methylococcales bacterium]|nr:hypothetical protein [Methylococcales bacterium]
MKINPQATDLNALLDSENPCITRLLSEKGKGAYFPKKGILAQAAQAGSCQINATVGIALEDDGTTAVLPSLEALDALSDPNIFKYAPSAGLPELRSVWKEMLYQKNETLNENHHFSLPVVTSALTHGIYVLGQLFLDESDSIISPEYYWEN